MHTSLLVHIPLWDATAIGAAGTLTSPAIDLSRFDRIDSVDFQLADAVAASPSIEIQYVQSDDGITFDAVGDQPAPIVTASATQFAATPKGFHAVPVPLISGRYCKIVVTELGVSATTFVTLALEAREK